MSDDKKQLNEKKADSAEKGGQGAVSGKNETSRSVYAKKKSAKGSDKRKPRSERPAEEFEQQIIDLARVTRVMAGGKRMRFRACVAIGDKKGRVGVGIAKGADVTLAVNKAVTEAKKGIITIPIIKGTIPHEIFHKFGAARIMLKPARAGRGIIAGGAIRMVLGLSGVSDITCKNLGTNNKVNIAKCTIEALQNLRKAEAIKKESPKKEEINKEEVK